jgi:uncharacterized protein YpmS
MRYSQLHVEDGTAKNSPPKWWRYRWVKTIGISFIVLTILVVTLALVLKFYVFTPEKSETNTNTTTTSRTTSKTTVTTSTTQQSGNFFGVTSLSRPKCYISLFGIR